MNHFFLKQSAIGEHYKTPTIKSPGKNIKENKQISGVPCLSIPGPSQYKINQLDNSIR